jgi:hypothetical protein
MGWMCIDFRDRSAVERKEYLAKEVFKWSNNDYELIKYAMVGSTFYGAIRDNKDNSVSAVVVLTEYKDGNFCYKDMGECSGPVKSNCPAGILNILTPTDDKYAIEWRERCRENLKKEKLVDVGDIIEFGSIFTFPSPGKGKIYAKIKSSFLIKMLDGEDADKSLRMSVSSMNRYIKEKSILRK